MNRLIPRIRKEYEEWPQLSLTAPQAARLWNSDIYTCRAALHALARTGFLTIRDDRRFVLREGPRPPLCPMCQEAA